MENFLNFRYNCSYWAKECDNTAFLDIRGIPVPAGPTPEEFFEKMRLDKAAAAAMTAAKKGTKKKGGKKKGGKKKGKKKKK